MASFSSPPSLLVPPFPESFWPGRGGACLKVHVVDINKPCTSAAHPVLCRPCLVPPTLRDYPGWARSFQPTEGSMVLDAFPQTSLFFAFFLWALFCWQPIFDVLIKTGQLFLTSGSSATSLECCVFPVQVHLWGLHEVTMGPFPRWLLLNVTSNVS